MKYFPPNEWGERRKSDASLSFVVCACVRAEVCDFFFLKDHGGITELFYTSEIQVSEYLFVNNNNNNNKKLLTKFKLVHYIFFQCS